MAGSRQAGSEGNQHGRGASSRAFFRREGPRAAAPGPIPATIGPYRVISQLGVGGMSVVYEAEQTAPRRTVAVKVLRAERVTDRLLGRFEREGEFLARLRDPAIAHVYEVGVDRLASPLRPYIAMELVRGPSLTAYADAHGLGAPARVALLAQVADAVEHAHREGIIHRDLKPANILVEQDSNGSARPKVLDFGVARLAGGESPGATLATQTGEVVGTLAYMSPEQIDGDPGAVGVGADVYALGVVLYELLVGRLPHDLDGRSIYAAARTIQEEEPTSLATIDRALRGDLETIVSKALAKEPGRRYQSASALAADLRRYLQSRPIAARPPSTAYQLRKFARRNKALVGGVVAALAALSAGLGIATWQAVEARRAQAVAEARFNDVRSLARSLVFDLHDEIARLPGSTRAREVVVDRGLEYLDLLAEGDPEDPDLRLELAEGYLQLARIQGGSDRWLGDSGDMPAARRSYGKAEALLDSLPSDYRRTRRYREVRALFLFERSLGTTRGGNAFTKESMKACIPMYEALLAEEPRSARRSADLAEAVLTLGLAHSNDGEFESAFRCLARAERLARDALEVSPGDRRLRTVLARAVYRDGYVRVHYGGAPLEGAVSSLTRAESLLADLVEESPGHAPPRLGLANVRLTLALAHAMHGRRGEALARVEAAIAEDERVAELDPDDRHAFRALMVHCHWAGSVHEHFASLEGRGPRARLEDWRLARKWHARNGEMLREYEERGWMKPVERDYPEQCRRNLAQCDEAIAELEARIASGGGKGTVEPAGLMAEDR